MWKVHLDAVSNKTLQLWLFLFQCSNKPPHQSDGFCFFVVLNVQRSQNQRPGILNLLHLDGFFYLYVYFDILCNPNSLFNVRNSNDYSNYVPQQVKTLGNSRNICNKLGFF